jgi:hypothetical protein
MWLFLFTFPLLALRESVAFLVNSSFILGDIWMSLLEIFFSGGEIFQQACRGHYGRKPRKLKLET